jgi:small subunit ribosomal protein S18
MSDVKREMAFGDRTGGGGRAGGGGARGGAREERGGGGDLERGGGRGFGRRKVCRYCADKNLKVDYKNAADLKYFVTERGKIVPRRISGNCARHQREVATAIKRGRQLALLPFTVMQHQ